MAARSKKPLPGSNPLSQPESFDDLLRGAPVHGPHDADDLREMAKFTERPNALGLPVHAIERPPRSAAQEAAGGLDLLPRKTLRAIGEMMRVRPSLCVRGRMAGPCPRPFRLRAVVSQSHAHLAQAMQAMLWPEPDEGAPADLSLLVLPEMRAAAPLWLTGARTAFVLGCDDARVGLLLAAEAAARLWREETGGKDQARIEILPGGSYPVIQSEASSRGEGSDEGSKEAERDAALVYCNESISEAWEAAVAGSVEGLAGRSPEDLRPAGGEPWVAWEGGRLCPLWRRPVLGARDLAAAPAWREAALHPDALPFGVQVNERGEIDLAASGEDAFVVIERSAAPAPFARTPEVLRVRRLVTYRFAKPEAMKLWAKGFPAPEVV
jgi:hypothetical protein